MKYLFMLVVASFVFFGCKDESTSQQDKPDAAKVNWIGAMKNVMHSGNLKGKIWLDSISKTPHLYGLGPTEGLQREIMVLNGKTYIAGVTTDSAIEMSESSDIKAPFFVYSHTNNWRESSLPDSIATIPHIETYLNELKKETTAPFMFRIVGLVDSAVIHIVNLHEGAIVNSPNDAHKDLMQFPIYNQEVEILGFFSRKHQAIFIHHDVLTHMHLITKDKKSMGHLDEIMLKNGKLYIGL